MVGFEQVLHEVHRRALWQASGLYLGGAWVGIQVTETLTSLLGLPDWVPVASLALLAAGLPVVLATAFLQARARGRGNENENGNGSAGREPPAAARPARRIFTWRNASLAGVVGFAALGAVTAGYMALRALGIGPVGSLVARGVLDERTPILLADFASSDSTLSRAATEALRVDLSQSPVVRLAEPEFVSAALARTGRPAGTPLTLPLARELAQREGLAGVIGGEIHPAGAGWVLTARLVSPASGQELASHRETSAGPEELVPAIDRLSRKIRERVGESLRTVRRDPPLEQVTTADLEALRAYSQAVRLAERGSDEEAIVLLEDAVARDTAFAMAWRKLGVVLNNRMETPSRAVAALERAYRHRDRLTERERHLTTGTWHWGVTGDHERAAAAYEALLRQAPNDPWALNNVALVYGELRQFERAAETLERALAVDSGSVLYRKNLAGTYVSLGRWEAAEATVEALRASTPGDPMAILMAVELEVARERWDEAERLAGLALEASGPSAWYRGLALMSLASLDAVRGRAEAAESRARDLEALYARIGAGPARLEAAAWLAEMRAALLGDTAAAVAGLEESLAAQPLDSLPFLDRPYVGLAAAWAAVGRPGRARELLAAYEAGTDPRLRGRHAERVDWVRGCILLAEGRAEEAVAPLRASDRGRCVVCSLPELGRAYAESGRPDSAVAVLRRYLETPSLRYPGLDAVRRVPVLERLAALHEARGEADAAAAAYGRIEALWADADPALRPRVDRARARREALQRGAG